MGQREVLTAHTFFRPVMIRNSKEMRSWMIYFLVRSFFFCSYNVFCAPLRKQEHFIAYALDTLCCTNVNKFQK